MRVLAAGAAIEKKYNNLLTEDIVTLSQVEDAVLQSMHKNVCKNPHNNNNANVCINGKIARQIRLA